MLKPPARGWLGIAAVLVVVFGAPTCLRWGNLVRYSFNDVPLKALEKSHPKCVFLGDSMLETRIDPVRLNEIAQVRCDLLPFPGSGSAIWYLLMKNTVGALTPPPELAIIFFRDRQLTLPGYRVTGRYRNGLETFMHGPEPQFEEKLARAVHDKTPFIERVSLQLYPAQNHRLECRESFQEFALNLVANRRTKPLVRDTMQDIFNLKHLRGDEAPAAGTDPEAGERLNPEELTFDGSVENSFLPMILDIAAQRHIRMVFFRVKGRPRNGQLFTPDRPNLQSYEHALHEYLDKHGAIFIDENGDPDVTADYYGEGDHVSSEKMRPYTEMFWRKLQPYLARSGVNLSYRGSRELP
jgi:hypothetical protein